ncbi:MAG TPA: DUF72 domain-containing protein [Bryobacteraceae bacterium]|nr:DUF72 domain-containing protein [Bryobacteraceae bacterium]
MVRVGPAGWNYKDWAGIVYPAKRPKDFSEPGFLARYFDMLEINSSFYGPPRPSSSEKWAKAVAHNRTFRFTAKLWRGFTHERKATAQDERLFKEGMAPLATHGLLGAVLMQFPISFQNNPENLAYVAELRRKFAEYPLVIEVRHRSWDNASVLEVLAGLEIGICNIDQPLLGKALRPAAHVTSSAGYVRLHGRNYRNWFTENKTVNERYDYLYSAEELQPWADRIKEIESHSRDVYAVTNNHNLGKAAANGAVLASMVSGRPIKAPPEWAQYYPDLKD